MSYRALFLESIGSEMDPMKYIIGLALISSAVFSFGSLMRFIDSRYGVSKKILLFLYLLSNAFVIFILKEYRVISLILGVFLTGSLYNVAGYFYDFWGRHDFGIRYHGRSAGWFHPPKEQIICYIICLMMVLFYFWRYSQTGE